MRYYFRIEDTTADSTGLLGDTVVDSPAELPTHGDVIFVPDSPDALQVQWREFVYDKEMNECMVHIRVASQLATRPISHAQRGLFESSDHAPVEGGKW
jgi:hypothetical protein